MGNIGPYINRHETYSYTDIPFCTSNLKQKSNSLGDVLSGHDYISIGYTLEFMVEKSVQLCTKSANTFDQSLFKLALSQHYYYQIVIDDLLWTGKNNHSNSNSYSFITDYIGVKEGSSMLFTHKQFIVSYNIDQIVNIEIKQYFEYDFHFIHYRSIPIDIETSKRVLDIPFTYSVKWTKTNATFTQRFEKYLAPKFFEHKGHWFALINSFVLILFLVGIVSMILIHTLRKDYARYEKDEFEFELDYQEEYGWKLVHGDVFRTPTFLTFLS